MTSSSNGGRAYYNEIDKYCAAWLRNLIAAGLIAPGDVDERDIREVSADDIRKYAQCHFFAGIGGWSQALRLALWKDGISVWTGSCPCQPFSGAGRRRGTADARHLWPVWFRLIRECRPSVVFGEQVAAAIAHGWLDEAAHDLEGEGYAVAASVLPACGVARPHRRDRIYFVADADRDQYLGAERRVDGEAPPVEEIDWPQDRTSGQSWRASNAGGTLEHPLRFGRSKGRSESELQRGGTASFGASVPYSVVGHPHKPGSQGREILSERAGERSSGTAGMEWIAGPDGKSRPVEPGICLLADGVPARVGKLRAYGNAIVPELAAEFIAAARETWTRGKES